MFRTVPSRSVESSESELQKLTTSILSEQNRSFIVFNRPHLLFSQQDLQDSLVSIHQHLASKHVSDSSLIRIAQKVDLSWWW